MSKVIAIINEPQSCLFCEFGHSVICVAKHNYMTDRINPNEVDKYNIYEHKCNETKPDWCPLKTIPEKTKNEYMLDEYYDGYTDGWNSCIDEILGKEKKKNAGSN